ncbi:hypothetical protein C8J55DRAFT_178609 [Lentinula edodes]|uniref:Uncharacterized protein n=1 Tax=Lentinula lateritia TaxID=40482 RepID=A0A9W9A0H6_9AGAR|nr:hypothetical protein C8J55DRAFT_178609 [Lentinula edodes]
MPPFRNSISIMYRSAGFPPSSPQTESDSNYNFSSQEESSFGVPTFSFNLMPNSPGPHISTGVSSMSEGPVSNTMNLFDDVPSSAMQSRPSLSIDTSYPNMQLMMDDWTTRTSSPISMNNMSIPSTPCYPVSPMSACTPALSSYRPMHTLRHTPSSNSLESTMSFDSTASYEDLSGVYSNEYYSPPISGDYSQYTPEMPMPMVFGAGNELGNFAPDVYGLLPSEVTCSGGIDNILFEKTQAHYRYHHPSDDAIIDYSTFISSPLSLVPLLVRVLLFIHRSFLRRTARDDLPLLFFFPPSCAQKLRKCITRMIKVYS